MVGRLNVSKAPAAIEDFKKTLSRDEIDDFGACAKLKSEAILRRLVHGTRQTDHIDSERVTRLVGPKPPVVDELPSLSEVLLSGPGARAKRDLLYSRKLRVHRDLASNLTQNDEVSSWVDAEGLHRELDEEDVDNVKEDGVDFSFLANLAGNASSMAALMSSDQSSIDAAVASASLRRCLSDTKIGPMRWHAEVPVANALKPWETRDTSEPLPLAEQPHRALAKRRWPSEEQFERYYFPPKPTMSEEIPMRRRTPNELPPPRRTIARLQEASSFGAQAYLWPALLQVQALEQQRSAAAAAAKAGVEAERQAPRSAAEAEKVYWKACGQLGVDALSPTPLFGERTLLRNLVVESTNQCYAIAEAVKACAPKEFIVDDVILTDMGAARLVEVALAGSRLRELAISRSILSYRTASTLYYSFRGRLGEALETLKLSDSGLGDDLGEAPQALPDHHAAAYARGEELLLRVEEAAETAAAELQKTVSEDGDDEGVEFQVDKFQSASLELTASLESTNTQTRRKRSKAVLIVPPRPSNKPPPAREPSKPREARIASNALSCVSGATGLRSTGGPQSKPKASKASVMEVAAEEDEAQSDPPTPLLLPVFGLLAQQGCALKRLDLSRTWLSEASVACLGRMLCHTPLEVLDLSQCGLDDDGLSVIATSLRSNRNLLELKLRGNSLTACGTSVSALLDSAARHIRLAHLDLAENIIPKACAKDFVTLLKWSCSLVAVHVLGANSEGGGDENHPFLEVVDVLDACRRTLGLADEATVLPVEPPSADDLVAQGAYNRFLRDAGKEQWLPEETLTYQFDGAGLEEEGVDSEAFARELLEFFVSRGIGKAQVTQLWVRLSGNSNLVHITGPAPVIEELRDKSPAEVIRIWGCKAEVVEELMLCRAFHIVGLQEWRCCAPRGCRLRHDVAALPTKLADQHPPELHRAAQIPSDWMPPCCWVCAKCAKVEIRWTVPDQGDGADAADQNARAFVRPSFANFQRIELIRQRIAGAQRACFSSQFLVPPGQHCYLVETLVKGRSHFLCSKDELEAPVSNVPLTLGLLEDFEKMCSKLRYSGPVNVLAPITAKGFEISEQSCVVPQITFGPIDPWLDDPVRTKALRQCFETDMAKVHLCDLCHHDQEPEVRATIWKLYDVYYQVYAMYAARSYWPYIKQVDVYSFFDEAKLLANRPERGSSYPSSPSNSVLEASFAKGMPDAEDHDAPLAVPRLKPLHKLLNLQDATQMIMQTMQVPKRRKATSARRASYLRDTLLEVTQEGEALSRHHFIEVMFRAAIAIQPGATNPSTSFEAFANHILRARIVVPPVAPFPRGLLVQVGEVCDILLSRRPVIREAWERFGGSVSSFQRLAQLIKLNDRSFTFKHVASIYALSKRPQRDADSTAQGLIYTEFCEAIARLALIWRKTGSNLDRFTEGPGIVEAKWPPQPQSGRPVRQSVVAARLDAFVAMLEDRMRPGAGRLYVRCYI